MVTIDTFTRTSRLTAEQKAFNLVYFPPIAIILVVFLFIDGRRLTEWLQPFSIFYSIALLTWFKPGLSEKAFKKATGSLFRKRKITIGKDGIRTVK